MSDSYINDFVIEDGILVKYTGGEKDVIVPDGVKKIGEEAFKDVDVVSVTLPVSVERIDKSAFEECSSLEKIELPDKITSVDTCVFRGCCSLKSVKLGRLTKDIMECAFDGCESLSHVVIPSLTKSIHERAFSCCPRIKLYFDGTEKELDKLKYPLGVNIAFVTTAKTDEAARELLKMMEVPFED